LLVGSIKQYAGRWEKITLIRASHCDPFVPDSYVLVPDTREVERQPGRERERFAGSSSPNLFRKNSITSEPFLIIIFQMELGLCPNIPGRAHREDSFIAAGEKHPFQKPATLIVEKVFVPFVLHEFRYDHDNAASRMLFGEIKNELNDGNDDEAIG
jgi:hypothetical protein